MYKYMRPVDVARRPTFFQSERVKPRVRTYAGNLELTRTDHNPHGTPPPRKTGHTDLSRSFSKRFCVLFDVFRALFDVLTRVLRVFWTLILQYRVCISNWGNSSAIVPLFGCTPTLPRPSSAVSDVFWPNITVFFGQFGVIIKVYYCSGNFDISRC